MLRIPSTVTLPFGYRVTVKQLKDSEFNTYAVDADGLWLAESRTILIRKSLPAKRRAYILLHEFGHSYLDWQHSHLDGNNAKP